MKNVLYWKECINDLNDSEEYRTTIEALLLGEYANLQLEKLHVQSISPIYSIRHSQDTRILFTTFQNKICLLEVILNHDYAKSRFLRHRHALKHHLQHLSPTPDSSSVTEPDLPIYKHDEIVEKSPALLHQHFIELNSIQEQAIQASFPMVLHGPAGSGKTTVAIELLQRLAKTQEQAVIYLTESNQLKNYVQNLWIGIQQDEIPEHIQFLTYQQFLEQSLEISHNNIVDIEHFHNWHYKNKDARKISRDALFKEFRIISGFETLQEYKAFSKRQYNLSNPPEQVWTLFQLYQRHLGNELFSKHLSSVSKPTDSTYLIIDEAQDFSFAQLKTLLDFSRLQTAVLLGDHQILFDDLSRFLFIKQFFFNQCELHIQPLELKLSYRCSQKVSDFANLIIQYKYHMTGGCIDKIETPFIETCPSILGCNEWFKTTAPQASVLQAQTFPSTWAIINFSNTPQSDFRHPIVFTPSDCKGLEFETVILWKPFENMSKQLNALLKNSSIDEKFSLHRAKSNKADSTFLNDFNALITAVTRAQHRLIIVDSSQVEKNAFINQLHESCSAIQIIYIEKEKIEPSEMWLEQVIYLLEKGFDTQAKRIFIEKLNHSEIEFNEFKEKNSSLSTTQISITSQTSITQQTRSPQINIQPKSPGIAYSVELETFYKETNYQKAIEELFFKVKSKELLRLLNMPYPQKTLLQIFIDDEEYLKAFVYQLSMNKNIFSLIIKLAKDLSNICPTEESSLKNILKFIQTPKNNINPKQHNGLFHVATLMQEIDIMALCLNSGVSVNLLTPEGPPIIIISKHPAIDLNAFALLIQESADFNFKDMKANTPLHYLVKNNRVNVIEYAFQHALNIDIHAMNANGKTAILQAATHDHFDCYKILIKYGANPFLANQSLYENYLFQTEKIHYLEYTFEHPHLLEIFNKNKIDCLISAISNKKTRLRDFIKNLVNLNHRNHLGQTPLLFAASTKQKIDILKALYSPEVDLDAFDSSGNNLFYYLEQFYDLSSIKYFRTQGMKLSYAFQQSGLPLKRAIQNKQEEYALFLAQEADTNQTTLIGETELHIAVNQGCLKIVQVLLAKEEIKPNQPMKGGLTPLYIATYKGYLDVVQELLKKEGIDPNQSILIGETPLHIAVKNDHRAVIVALLKAPNINPNQATPNGVTPLHVAVEIGHLEVIQTLLNAPNINPNPATSNGLTPLHIAAKNGRQNIVQELLKVNGIDPNKTIMNGETPLFISAQMGHLDVVQTLLNAPNIKSNLSKKNGSTPLFVAAEKDFPEIVQELLKIEGIDPNQPLPNGATPLFIAAQNNNLQIVEQLLLHEKIDISLPLKSTQDALEEFVKNKEQGNPGLAERMSAHIHDYKEKFPEATIIEIKPIEIAFIMGHSNVQNALAQFQLSEQSTNDETISRQFKF